MKKSGAKVKYPGKAPVSKEKLAKHGRGEGLDLRAGSSRIRTKIQRQRLRIKERVIEKATEQAARTELLLTEEPGFLETEAGETTTQFRQKQIAENVDITSATKHFDLKMDFGPYRMRYTRNGRHLLVGGKLGHLAAFDWVTKKLACELNVMESIHDVAWLHVETMFAVAQKDWTYIYDNTGIELHCIKRMYGVTRLEFLPYHFLLASSSNQGFLVWLDVSIGQILSRFDSKLGRINVMTQNPSNAVLCVGNSKGVVSMWSPNSRQPLAKMLCHHEAITACNVHPHGTYMATGSCGRSLKIWDIRQLAGPVNSAVLQSPAHNISYSQTGLLSVSMGNIVEVYRDSHNDSIKRYMSYKSNWPVSGMQFCPYEDVLGITTAKGFTSLLVPGSGEANFDALEVNPFQTKTQRREAEVKALLDKIQPEFITLDPSAVAEVDVPTLKEKVEAKKKLLHIKPKSIDFKPRKTKAKGKGGTAKVIRTKKILKEISRKEAAEKRREVQAAEEEKRKEDNSQKYGVLNRFLPKGK
ncbi:WD repeat-containing protein 46 [Venturia canescens]|uniref:WD repeat-containing protein 46 n=1 Tax=Venturia canescens TaxID=32260 RepID=UPI001C9CB25A|nr:WD repeat-containing protein 46 [Venturia canescens]